jgi:hypothetical protein
MKFDDQQLFLMRLFKVAAGKPIWATVHSSRAILERPADIFFVDFFPALLWRKTPGAPSALFRARAGTWIEPPTFRKPAGWLPHMKDFDPSEDRMTSKTRHVRLSLLSFMINNRAPSYQQSYDF